MSLFHQVSRLLRMPHYGWGMGLLSLLLLTGCPTQEPTPPPPPPQAKDNELHFDMRYYDSIEMYPQSERTKRQLAISQQLTRLENETNPVRRNGKIVPMPKIKMPNDSIYEQMGEGNPVRGFANRAELLADIHRKIDSLKVLEHIPLTPH
ncbi:hypothetical protein [Hymenobacter terrenus]|uniref:hypothetical protein n=1 Tax=Hymenobacter terrenus TaxID=1629124 RepID=UPI000619DCD1|nr:hypothetical protein [Hymenobacter terrenus]